MVIVRRLYLIVRPTGLVSRNRWLILQLGHCNGDGTHDCGRLNGAPDVYLLISLEALVSTGRLLGRLLIRWRACTGVPSRYGAPIWTTIKWMYGWPVGLGWMADTGVYQTEEGILELTKRMWGSSKAAITNWMHDYGGSPIRGWSIWCTGGPWERWRDGDCRERDRWCTGTRAQNRYWHALEGGFSRRLKLKRATFSTWSSSQAYDLPLETRE